MGRSAGVFWRSVKCLTRHVPQGVLALLARAGDGVEAHVGEEDGGGGGEHGPDPFWEEGRPIGRLQVEEAHGADQDDDGHLDAREHDVDPRPELGAPREHQRQEEEEERGDEAGWCWGEGCTTLLVKSIRSLPNLIFIRGVDPKPTKSQIQSVSRALNQSITDLMETTSLTGMVDSHAGTLSSPAC